ncbi:hypothetical protein PVA45_05655 [Entomospira entomophila]|uniref:Cysteine hydrolase n=1 Tax=Entomospira entomophila TaxID=2719988 RepID=A0A968G9C9_9SPIO|nr:cysteine hydrolase [Entomospira entomophilus]NIZ40983.1 cysteine hydrolase [Entomospira entomophilus]WDI35196.1 hypothetical protein PVA45_05655 [Entomospira entomophilus]
MSSRKRHHLLIIDPQNDFCDSAGALFVPGASQDMERLAQFIHQKKTTLDRLFVTLDSHHRYDIAHPLYWVQEDGSKPQPLTTVTVQDIEKKRIIPRHSADVDRSYHYLSELESRGISHIIWPEHCIIGEWGHQIYPIIAQEIREFQERMYQAPTILFKGMNPYTEHFSALSAIVPDSSDRNTQLQTSLVRELLDCDQLYIAGEALSHCVASTINDLIANIDRGERGKIVLLLNATSPVSGFESMMDVMLEEWSQSGIHIKDIHEALEEE